MIGPFQASPTSDGRYVLFTSNAFTVQTSGVQQLTIAGTSPSGSNNSALIDGVIVTGGVVVQH